MGKRSHEAVDLTLPYLPAMPSSPKSTLQPNLPLDNGQGGPPLTVPTSQTSLPSSCFDLCWQNSLLLWQRWGSRASCRARHYQHATYLAVVITQTAFQHRELMAVVLWPILVCVFLTRQQLCLACMNVNPKKTPKQNIKKQLKTQTYFHFIQSQNHGIMESLNHQGWKRPTGSSSPTIHLSPIVLTKSHISESPCCFPLFYFIITTRAALAGRRVGLIHLTNLFTRRSQRT